MEAHTHIESQYSLDGSHWTDVNQRGNIEIGYLAKDIHVSRRYLERIFQENTGISPKQLSSLIRYQYIWNDVLFRPRFRPLDAVEKYGYTD